MTFPAGNGRVNSTRRSVRGGFSRRIAAPHPRNVSDAPAPSRSERQYVTTKARKREGGRVFVPFRGFVSLHGMVGLAAGRVCAVSLVMVLHRAMVAGVTVLLAAMTAGLAASAAPDDLASVPIERFQRVDERLYRGAQPTEAGFRRLRDLGVQTVVNLRIEADAKLLDERRIVESLGMRYINLPVEDGNFFTRSRRIPDNVIRGFFNVLDQSDTGPVFVHCHRGADRTGALVAFYRVARHGWDNERALKEAREIGLRSWYHGLQDQISRFTLATLLGQ